MKCRGYYSRGVSAGPAGTFHVGCRIFGDFGCNVGMVQRTLGDPMFLTQPYHREEQAGVALDAQRLRYAVFRRSRPRFFTADQRKLGQGPV
jgi:hypothetical protein